MFPPPKNRKKKRRKNRNTQLFAFAGLGVAVILAIVLLISLIPKGNGPLQQVEMPMKAGDAYAACENAVYYVQGDSLYGCDLTGVVRWETALPETGMQVYASSEAVAVYNEAKVCVYTQAGKLISTTEFYGTVQKVCCSSMLTAVLVEDSSGTSRIVVLDREGNEKQRETFSDKYVMDFGFSEDSLYIYTVSMNQVQPSSNIVTYSDTLNNTGNVTIDGEILQGVLFDTEKIYAVGTNHVIETDYLGKKGAEKLIYGWVVHDWSLAEKQEPVILFVQGGEASDGKHVYAARLSTLTGEDLYLQMPANTLRAAVTNNRIYAFAQDGVRIYNHSGAVLAEHALLTKAESVDLLPGDRHALVSDGEAIYLVTLP